MKLVIDISDKVYKCVMDGTWCGSLYDELKSGVSVKTCADCVSRDSVNNLVDELARAISDERTGLPLRGRDAGRIICDIWDLPSVEPERPHGNWIRVIDPDVNAWTGGHTCSECGRTCVQMSMNYCANCGADMRNKQALKYADNETAYGGLQSAT